MANALPTMGSSPGNVRQSFGTHYTTPVGGMMASGGETDLFETDEKEQARRNRKIGRAHV